MSDSVPGPLQRRDGEPLFADPWQAQVLAMAAHLVEAGRFTAAQWSATLAEEIRAADAAGAPDHSGTYYACALHALERLVDAQGLLTADSLQARKAAWARAYENTPHGQPVELSAATGEG